MLLFLLTYSHHYQVTTYVLTYMGGYIPTYTHSLFITPMFIERGGKGGNGGVRRSNKGFPHYHLPPHYHLKVVTSDVLGAYSARIHVLFDLPSIHTISRFQPRALRHFATRI